MVLTDPLRDENEGTYLHQVRDGTTAVTTIIILIACSEDRCG